MSVIFGTGRPSDGYMLADGTTVDSVTEIIGKFKDSSGLIAWAHKLGKEGKDHRAEMEAAGRWGSAVHTALESLVRNNSAIAEPGLQTAAEAARLAFQKPSVKRCLDGLTHVEVPMVHSELKYGGTFDFIADGVISDWKTSNDVYIDYVIQMGAYYELCLHNGMDVKAARIISIKKAGDSPNYYGTGEVIITNIGPEMLKQARLTFLHLLNAHNLIGSMKTKLKEAKSEARKTAKSDSPPKPRAKRPAGWVTSAARKPT